MGAVRIINQIFLRRYLLEIRRNTEILRREENVKNMRIPTFTLSRRGLLAMANLATLYYWRLADDLSKDNDPKVAPSNTPVHSFRVKTPPLLPPTSLTSN